jgi:peptide methionine sulfoxide reductase msrA/msrB
LEQSPGVISVESGYMGGSTANPDYREVSSHRSGHAEVVQVIYNPSKTSYEELAKLFFEIHDPTQVNRQGPDVGNQYRSEIFYRSVEQKEIAEELVSILEKKGLKVATRIHPATTFWKAEDYHQDYYMKNGGTPYCHRRVDRFS